jgi:hypothetical protein
MNEITDWLQQHGLEDYVELFQQQEIRVSDFPLLTEDDEREL